MLVDNDNSVNILFEGAFDQMNIDHHCIPMAKPIYGFDFKKINYINN